MSTTHQSRLLARRLSAGCLCCLAWAGLTLGSARAELPPVADAPGSPSVADAPGSPAEELALDAAVAWALVHNPELAALREQHGIAAASIVIAQTYPFNPLWEAKIRGVSGPDSAGITNRVSNEHKLLLEVEIRQQGKYRRQGAFAALSRTDWEIAFQETAFAVRVVRAFDGLLYREAKLRLIDKTVELNHEAVGNVRKSVEGGKLKPADLIVAQTEEADARAQYGASRLARAQARSEFRRAMGLTEGIVNPRGTLEMPGQAWDVESLVQTALERRADLKARLAAADEADARLRLAVADRFGNPNMGPAYEYDPGRVNLIGWQIALPLPLFNTHRGEILQRQAELGKAILEVRSSEFQAREEVHAAVARLKEANDWLKYYDTQTLPQLEKALKDIERLFSEGDPGVDLIRVIDIRRKLLKAREGRLDAVWEVRQGVADLTAAAGDLSLAIGTKADPAGK